MNRSLFYIIIPVFVCGFLCFSCSENKVSDVSFLSLKDSSSDSAKIESADSERQYVIVPFSADSYSEGTSPSGSVSYDIDFSGSGAASKIFRPIAQFDYDKASKILREQMANRYESQFKADKERYEKTKMLLEKISDGLKQKPEGYLRSKYKKTLNKNLRPFEPEKPLFSFSDTIEIYSPFGISENEKITGIRRGMKENCALYVHDDYNAQVSDSVAQSLLETFDEITQKRDRTFWGTESDINGDGGTIIFLSDDLGSGVIGFFRPLDLLSQESVDELVCEADGEPDGCYKSNEMEIIFSQYVHDNFYKELIDATLAHEYFHLINFSVKTLPPLTERGQLIQEDLWLNEGMAHLSEDITGHGFDAFPTAGYYLESISQASIAGDVDESIQIGFGDDTLERRGGAMLFLRYLFEQKGGADYSSSDSGDVTGAGADFLKQLNSSAFSGINNIEQTYGDSFENLFRAWIAAIVLDGTGLSNKPEYNYLPEEDDPFTDQERGFDLRGSRTLPTGSKVELDGPYMSSEWSTASGIRDFSSSVYESGADMFLITVGAGSSLDIKMKGSSGQGLGMTIVRVK